MRRTRGLSEVFDGFCRLRRDFAAASRGQHSGRLSDMTMPVPVVQSRGCPKYGESRCPPNVPLSHPIRGAFAEAWARAQRCFVSSPMARVPMKARLGMTGTALCVPGSLPRVINDLIPAPSSDSPSRAPFRVMPPPTCAGLARRRFSGSLDPVQLDLPAPHGLRRQGRHPLSDRGGRGGAVDEAFTPESLAPAQRAPLTPGANTHARLIRAPLTEAGPVAGFWSRCSMFHFTRAR